MHEVSIIENVITIVSNKAIESDLEKVTKVSLRIGELSGVLEDSLRFAFTAVSKGTIVEDAELIIEKVEAQAHCNKCNISFKIDHFNKLCPECGEFSNNFISGYELFINTIEGD